VKKVLLIQPSPYDPKGKPIKKNRLYFVGLGMPLLAALTPAGWTVEIILETIESIPFDTDADIIGIGSMGHGVIRSIDIAREFKKRGKTVVLGGYMVSLMPDEAQKYADAVVVGDAELVWPTLLHDWETGQLKSIYEQPINKLETPLPRFDLIIQKKIGDFLPVQAGRGCPHSCSFCSVYCLYKGRYLRRDISDVVRDIQHVKGLGFKKFMLLDDNIAADREFMMELCREIKTLNMEWISQCSIEIGRDSELLRAVASSGCTALSFGLESITQASLDDMDKSWAHPEDYPQLIENIQRNGIDVSTEMVVGADGDTLDSIRATATFIRRHKILVPRFYILTPIPGTKFYTDMKRQGRIYINDIYAYNGSQAVHIPKNMTPDELTDAYWALYREVFSWSSIIHRTLMRRDFWRKAPRYLFYFLINVYYRQQIHQGITPNII
jgi:radical SAM superfamily enzyme YgiQ (UPF0313 family)